MGASEPGCANVKRRPDARTDRLLPAGHDRQRERGPPVDEQMQRLRDMHATKTILLRARGNISRKVCRFRPSERHIRHFWVRIEQEEGKAVYIEIWRACDRRKRRCLPGRLALVGSHHMTTGTPASGDLFSMTCVCG